MTKLKKHRISTVLIGITRYILKLKIYTSSGEMFKRIRNKCDVRELKVESSIDIKDENKSHFNTTGI